MTTRERVLRVLRGSAADRTRFSFTDSNGRTVRVSGATYRRVAGAIESGRIVLVEDPTLTGGAAVYNPANRTRANGMRVSGTLRVPRIRGRVQQGFLIHEATHASFDMTHTNGLPVMDEEASCYIAEALFYRRMGLDRRRYRSNAWGEAVQVVNSLLRNGSINTTALNNLRNAVATHPVYAGHGTTGCYTSNG